MTVTIVCGVPATEFLLGEFFREYPDVTATLERVVPLGSSAVPYLWVRGSGRIVDGLETEREVATATVVDETEEGKLLKIRWRGSPDKLIDVVADSDGTLLSGGAAQQRWTLHLRFPGRRQLEQFHDACREEELDLMIERILEGENDTDDATDLTAAQRETIRIALERGYFEVPREATLEDLAAEFGISDTAVSQRLRRALATVVRGTVTSDST